MICNIPSIKTREDFVNISINGRSSPQSGLILQALDNLTIKKSIKTNKRLGITVTKKIGSAVIRNRCRRRLRSVANEIILCYGKDRTDYVLIASKETLNRNIELLKLDLKKALKDLGLVKNI
jgi:ribonuclease P protein component